MWIGCTAPANNSNPQTVCARSWAMNRWENPARLHLPCMWKDVCYTERLQTETFAREIAVKILGGVLYMFVSCIVKNPRIGVHSALHYFANRGVIVHKRLFSRTIHFIRYQNAAVKHSAFRSDCLRAREPQVDNNNRPPAQTQNGIIFRLNVRCMFWRASATQGLD